MMHHHNINYGTTNETTGINQRILLDDPIRRIRSSCEVPNDATLKDRLQCVKHDCLKEENGNIDIFIHLMIEFSGNFPAK